MKNLSRRTFLKSAAAAAPAGAVIVCGRATAQDDLPHVTDDDPTAKALAYVHDASMVDKSNPLAARYEPGQMCSNCVQLQGNEGDEWRPCPIFPGKLVKATGWCSVWAAKPQ